MKIELLFQYGYGIMICKKKRFVFNNKSEVVEEKHESVYKEMENRR